MTLITSPKVPGKPVIREMVNPGLWNNRALFSVPIWAEELGIVEVRKACVNLGGGGGRKTSVWPPSQGRS